MPSNTKENYLKALYFLSQRDEKISLSELSKQLEVSTPTVNSMVKKLEANGWVLYQKYKPIKLTEKGKQMASLIVRKHRLTEMFLVQIMNFGWEEVHDIAEEMEHIDSTLLFDRMDELLGYPTVDPHGSPIPDKEGKISGKEYKSLSEYGSGVKVRLCALAESSRELLQYLNSKKIALGTEIKVHKKEDFDQSMDVSYGSFKHVSLSRAVAENLLVEPLKVQVQGAITLKELLEEKGVKVSWLMNRFEEMGFPYSQQSFYNICGGSQTPRKKMNRRKFSKVVAEITGLDEEAIYQTLK